MADLIGGDRSGEPSRGGDHGRDRGQLLLVVGFAIAVGIVGLVLLLNSAIYLENLSTRGVDTGADAALEYRNTVEGELWPVVAWENDRGIDSRSALEANVTDRVDRFDTVVSKRHLEHGRNANLTNTTLDDGTRLRQTDANRTLTSESGAANWTMANEAQDVRQFEVNTTGGLAATDSPENESFRIDVEGNSGNQWSLYVYDDPADSRRNLAVENGTEAISEDVCGDLISGTPRVNAVAGTVNGADCDAISFAKGTDAPYEIAVTFGNRSEGTYDAVTNGTLSAAVAGNYDDAPNSPHALPVVYTLHADVVYESSTLGYRSRIKIGPPDPETEAADRLTFAKSNGEEVRTSDGDVLEFRIENTADEQITVEQFELDATDLSASMTVDDGNAPELDIQRTDVQTGEANRVGTVDADGSRYDFVDDSDAGGQYAIIDAGVDDAEVDIRRFSSSIGTMEVTYAESEADITVTFVLSDGTEEVFYLHER